MVSDVTSNFTKYNCSTPTVVNVAKTVYVHCQKLTDGLLDAACSRRGKFTVVPILVGSLANDKEQLYGELLAPYLADPDNLFVISSDFCHWGRRSIIYERVC